MTTHALRVDLGPRSYDIEVGRGTLAALPDFLLKRQAVSHAIVVTDSGVEALHAAPAAEALAAAGITCDLLVVEAGEGSKSLAVAESLWCKLLELETDRKSIVVALGGGVVGDLAGFVAATYGRGLALVQVPTTLLAQVDSSVGGKTGINLPGAKNMVGAFWQPIGVLVDPAVLATLPDREYRSGLAEVVKYGVILDSNLFEFLEQHVSQINARDADTLAHVIARCCRLKADVVEQDEREESGLRAVLNYGHTFGHALEATTGYATWLHGEAVAIGMMQAARLAERLGRVDSRLVARQKQLLTALHLPVASDRIDRDALMAAMLHDKKVAHGQLRFILPDRIGHVELVGSISPDLVRTILSE